MTVPILTLAAALTVNLVADPDVLEPSVLNEVEHALARAEEIAERAAPARPEDRAALARNLKGLSRTDAAIRLVSTQRADGTWRAGTNDVTRVSLELLRNLSGQRAKTRGDDAGCADWLPDPSPIKSEIRSSPTRSTTSGADSPSGRTPLGRILFR